jgi:hypothetical protein
MQRAYTVSARTRRPKPGARGPTPLHPVLRVQRAAGNAATAALLGRPPAETAHDAGSDPSYSSLAHLVLDLAEPLAVRFLIGHGLRDRNRLTNVLFWARHPAMVGEKIRRSTAVPSRSWWTCATTWKDMEAAQGKRRDALHDDHVVVDDPARQARANRRVTWEEARAMGYFYYRLVLEA